MTEEQILALRCVARAAEDLPIGYAHGKLIVNRSTTEAEIIHALAVMHMWLKVARGADTATTKEMEDYLEQGKWPLD